MSNTIYLDINAKNSHLNSENNLLRYDLPEAVSLPTGTEIKCLQSIVNQQGTVGTSITFEEDIKETIIIQYYITDTTYSFPTPNLSVPGATFESANWQIFDNFEFKGNAEVQFGTNNSSYTGKYGTIPVGQASCGGTEIIMPLVMPCEMNATGDGIVTDLEHYWTPLTCEINILIEKGTYNTNKLAELITDQINGLELINETFTAENTFRELQITNERYTGYISNNTSLRNILVEDADGFLLWNSSNTRPGQFKPYRNEGAAGTYVKSPSPLLPKEANFDGISAVAVTPTFSSGIRKSIVQGYVGTNAPSVYNVNGTIWSGSPDKNFFIGLQTIYNKGSTADPYQTGFLSYNPFTAGYNVGAADFSLKVNNDGEFELDYTHTPRYIPTYDYFGNKQDNPGQEAAYIKRLAGVADPRRINEHPTGRTIASDPIGSGWYKTQSQPMRRTTGFMVLNWAYQTCKNEKRGSPSPIGGQRDDLRANIPENILVNMDKNRTFDEWFNSKQEGREAWENTLWYRLGFTYDDLQNDTYFEKQFFPDKDDRNSIKNTTIEGFTTNQRLDVSSVTTSSTLVNGQGHSASGTFQPKVSINPINGSISGIQAFNTGDINVPYDIYNNNAVTAQIQKFGKTTGAYKGSLYYGAVMVPVITTGIPVSASRLPVLNNNGYMLVTSDIVEPNDIVKAGSFLGLLDIIPKSNLQNADYIQDRNVLSHTISNPQVVKQINIKITNPDLTDIPLEPNSAFLLAITFPQPKQTIMLADLEYSAQEQQVASALQQSTAQSVEAGTLPVLPTFQQYNTTGEAAPPTATEAGDKKSASRRRIDIAKKAVAYSKLKTDEEKEEFLKKLPESDRQEVTDVAGRIPKRGGGGGVRAGGGAKAPTRRTDEELATELNKIRNVEQANKFLVALPREQAREVERIASARAGYTYGPARPLERITALNQLDREESERQKQAVRGRRGQPGTPAGTTEEEKEERQSLERARIKRPGAPRPRPGGGAKPPRGGQPPTP